MNHFGLVWHLRTIVYLLRRGIAPSPFAFLRSLWWHYRWRWHPPKPPGHGGE